MYSRLEAYLKSFQRLPGLCSKTSAPENGKDKEAIGAWQKDWQNAWSVKETAIWVWVKIKPPGDCRFLVLASILVPFWVPIFDTPIYSIPHFQLEKFATSAPSDRARRGC